MMEFETIKFKKSISRHVAVVISGAGYRDGAEINESVFSILALQQLGYATQVYAPSIFQKNIVNHINGKNDIIGSSRNILEESARIGRSAIDVELIDIENVCALVFPGGFGVIDNFLNTDEVDNHEVAIPQIRDLVLSAYRKSLPIGAICIAPVLIGNILSNHIAQKQDCKNNKCDEDIKDNFILTVGKHNKLLDLPYVEQKICLADDAALDRRNKLVSTPAFMIDENDPELNGELLIPKIYRGISKLAQYIDLLISEGDQNKKSSLNCSFLLSFIFFTLLAIFAPPSSDYNRIYAQPYHELATPYGAQEKLTEPIKTEQTLYSKKSTKQNSMQNSIKNKIQKIFCECNKKRKKWNKAEDAADQTSQLQNEKIYIRPITNWKSPMLINSSKRCDGKIDNKIDKDPVMQFECKLTYGIWDIGSKPEIYKTNNLMRRVGSAVYASGTPIVIKGRLFDAMCNPITNAIVEIYHADHNGNWIDNSDVADSSGAINNKYLNQSNLYTKSPLMIHIDDSSSDEYATYAGVSAYSNEKGNKRNSRYGSSRSQFDSNFTGSGTSVTDNLGNFIFFTIMPGSSPPKVKIYVRHKDISEFETYMFFAEYNNEGDSHYRNISSDIDRSTLLAYKQEDDCINQVGARKTSISSNKVNKYTESSKNPSIYSFNIVVGEHTNNNER